MTKSVVPAACLLLLAGCCAVPFAPDEVPAVAPSQGGIWERQVTISIFGPDEPVDGVPVFVFWPHATEAGVYSVMGLRSQDGRVVAHVPAGVKVEAVAGGSPWTTEWGFDLVDAGTADANAVLRVYPEKVIGNRSGTWSPVAVSTWKGTGTGSISWLLEDVTPGLSNETRSGFAERLTRVEAEVAWTNSATAQADLGVGAWQRNSEGLRCNFHDTAGELGSLGAKKQAYDSQTDGYESGAPCSTSFQYGGRTPNATSAILVGPGTGRPAVMPTGLAYTTDYVLHFGYPSTIEEACAKLPGSYRLHYVDPTTGDVTRTEERRATAAAPMAAFIAIGLLGAAFLMRRRQE